jgi:hypothetical protein
VSMDAKFIEGIHKNINHKIKRRFIACLTTKFRVLLQQLVYILESECSVTVLMTYGERVMSLQHMYLNNSVSVCPLNGLKRRP